MKVSVIWEHGEVTTWQSANALKIAQHWLYTRADVLAVHCTTNCTLYLKEGRQPYDKVLNNTSRQM